MDVEMSMYSGLRILQEPAYFVLLRRRLDSESLCHAFWYGGELHARHRKRDDIPLIVECIS